MSKKNQKLNFFLAGGFVFFLFICFSYLIHKHYFSQQDFNNTIVLQNHISRRFDGFFSALSYIGEVQFVGLFLLIIMFIHRKWKSIYVLFIFVFFHVFELFGKVFVNHKPPPNFMLRTEIPSNFPQFYISTANSYPSGHAARALFLTLIIGFLIYKTKKFNLNTKYIIYGVLILYDVLMLTSRVYLGEHWTSDVIGGSLLGASMALMSFVFL